MRAICIQEPGTIVPVERAVPNIERDDQVLVKVKCVGICGSDIHIFHGTNPFAVYPRVWGHEFTGEVVAVGEGVRDLSVGDHVSAEPFSSCGKCYACRHGRGNVCKELKVYGVHQDGGCQEYIVMERAKVHKVPDDMPAELAVLAEPVTIGFQACSRGRVEEGDFVLVMGAGTVGLTCLMAAKAKGATVMITDLYDQKLEFAKRFGADYVVNVKKTTIGKELEAIGEEPNVILDAVGSKTSLEEAVDMVSSAGRVVELGFANIHSEISHVTLMKKEVDICGTRLQSGQFGAAIEYIDTHREDLQDFITQRFEIDDITEAFRFVTDHPDKVRKAIVKMA